MLNVAFGNSATLPMWPQCTDLERFNRAKDAEILSLRHQTTVMMRPPP